MGAWKICVLSAGKKNHVHKIPPFRGGLGGESRFYFYGREDFPFLILKSQEEGVLRRVFLQKRTPLLAVAL